MITNDCITLHNLINMMKMEFTCMQWHAWHNFLGTLFQHHLMKAKMKDTPLNLSNGKLDRLLSVQSSNYIYGLLIIWMVESSGSLFVRFNNHMDYLFYCMNYLHALAAWQTYFFCYMSMYLWARKWKKYYYIF